MEPGQRLVHAPALGLLRAQRVELADHHGGLVEVNGLDGQPRHALGQIVLAGEHPQADGGGVQGHQLGRVVGQIPDDDFVLVLRVGAERHHHRQAAALGRVHAGDVQHGAAHHQFGLHCGLAAQLQAEVPQPGLARLHQPGQGDGGAHVRQRVVRGLVRQAVGGGQVLELEAGLAIRMAWPFQAVRPQRVGAAHRVHQVPAATAVLPLPGIGLDQVAPEQETRDLVVETDAVVAHAHGAGAGQLALDLGGESVFRHPLRLAALWRDAGDQAAFGVGQAVQRRLAVQRDRRLDLVQVGIRAHPGKLCRRIPAGDLAEGLVVVPEEAEIRRHRRRATTLPME